MDSYQVLRRRHVFNELCLALSSLESRDDFGLVGSRSYEGLILGIGILFYSCAPVNQHLLF